MLPGRGAPHTTTASAQGSQSLEKAAAGRAMADCWEQGYDSNLLRATQLDFKLVGEKGGHQQYQSTKHQQLACE